jgi:hypothetical protein
MSSTPSFFGRRTMFTLLSRLKSRHQLLKTEFIRAETSVRIMCQHFLKKSLVDYSSGPGALSWGSWQIACHISSSLKGVSSEERSGAERFKFGQE